MYMSSFIQTIIAFLLSVFTVAAVPGNAKPTADAEILTDTINVMSFNVYVAGFGAKSPENRADEVVEQIRRVMPDSFGLQEASPEWIAQISTAMPEYAYVGIDRDADGTGEASPVFYLKNKYTVVESSTFWLSPTPDVKSKGWDASYRRICTYALLRNNESGFTYAHFNAHLDHIGSLSRYNSARLVTNRVNSLGYATVLTGDFNAKEGSNAYTAVLESGMLDSKYIADSVVNPGPTFHGYMMQDKTTHTKAIDFIFVSEGSTVSEYVVHKDKINGIYPSDHFAVSATVTLTGATETDGTF